MRQLGSRASLRRLQGFTLFELAVAASIVAILSGLLLQRLQAYRTQAELAGVDSIAALLRTALAMKSSALHHSGKQADLASLAGMNPFDLLAERPPNYLGEYYAPDAQSLDTGNWYFDRKTKALVYLSNSDKRFPHGTQNLLTFKVELIRLPPIPAKPDARPPTRSLALIQTNR